jgi:hypothetical protein
MVSTRLASVHNCRLGWVYIAKTTECANWSKAAKGAQGGQHLGGSEITDAELAAADQCEQLAAYKRVAATLASGRQAWAYVDARSAPEPS